jgi:hypothetical protein
MTPTNDAREGTIEVEHNGDTITVPTKFDVADVATYFGISEWPITVDRVFVYDGVLRAESFTGKQYVEVAYHPNGGHAYTTGAGWVADSATGVEPEDVHDRGIHNLGRTVWIREGVDG